MRLNSQGHGNASKNKSYPGNNCLNPQEATRRGNSADYLTARLKKAQQDQGYIVTLKRGTNRSVRFRTETVENSSPAIEKVDVIVEEPAPTPTPEPTPEPTPRPNTCPYTEGFERQNPPVGLSPTPSELGLMTVTGKAISHLAGSVAISSLTAPEAKNGNAFWID